MALNQVRDSGFASFIPNVAIVKIILITAGLLFLFRTMIIIIPAGHVGVVYDKGRGVLPIPMREGLNFAIPLWQSVTLFDTRIQEYTMSIVPDEGALARDDSLDAPTSDGQQVRIDATVIFRVVSDKTPEILRTVGMDYVEKLIRPYSRSQIRMVISRYTASEIYSEKRQVAETAMSKELKDLLLPNHIMVDKVLLRSVAFSQEYSRAIEQKMIAEQRVKQAEFEVKEASQRAQSKIAEAKGLAEAQNMQKSSLTQEYLQLEAIKKWNGILPQVVGSGNAPFINIPLR